MRLELGEKEIWHEKCISKIVDAHPTPYDSIAS